MVGLIAQVGNHRQLFLLHLGGDLLQHPGSGDLGGSAVTTISPCSRCQIARIRKLPRPVV